MAKPAESREMHTVADPTVAARLHRWSLAARLVMAILGWCLWKVGRLIGAR